MIWQKETRELMGMPITVEVVDEKVTSAVIEDVYEHFRVIDEQFSPYKETSEVTEINLGKKILAEASPELREVMKLAEQTKHETDGYFDVFHQGKLDPSGIVKGWAIEQVARQLNEQGFRHFYVEAGGDIQVAGLNKDQQPWQVGIRHPFLNDKVVKVLSLSEMGVATSGSYERGNHIYNPHDAEDQLQDVVSITVLGPDVVEADRFATAAFAMGRKGVEFIEQRPGLEAYQITRNGQAVMTSGFKKYVKERP